MLRKKIIQIYQYFIIFRDCHLGSRFGIVFPSLERSLEETSQINLLKGKYRLLVASGWTGSVSTATVEIIDLENPDIVCSNLPNHRSDYGLETMQGGLTFLEQPILCGGRKFDPPTDSCRIYQQGAWHETIKLPDRKAYFHMTTSPFKNRTISLLATGGTNQAAIQNNNSRSVQASKKC